MFFSVIKATLEVLSNTKYKMNVEDKFKFSFLKVEFRKILVLGVDLYKETFPSAAMPP